MKGLSGISNDMRELESRSDPRATLAVRYFEYRVGLNAGMLAAALQGARRFRLHRRYRRKFGHYPGRIAERLRWLGVSLDEGENSRHARLISQSDSRIPVYVIPTDEELMIAEHTLSLLVSRPSSNVRHARVS